MRRPKLDGFTGIVRRDPGGGARDPEVPRKHSVTRRTGSSSVFATSTGCSSAAYTIVKDECDVPGGSTAAARPSCHDAPSAGKTMPRVDFGEATVEVGGRREKIAFFCLILPHFQRLVRQGLSPGDDRGTSSTAHVSAFGTSTKAGFRARSSMTTRRLRDGADPAAFRSRVRRTQAFTHLQSHYLFRDRFGRPGKGNDKGKVEALVKYGTAPVQWWPIPKRCMILSVLNEQATGSVPGAARRAGRQGAGGGAGRGPISRPCAIWSGGSLRGLRACAGP